MAEKDTDVKEMPSDQHKAGSSRDQTSYVEELLDKVAKIAGEPGTDVDGATGNFQDVVNQFGGLSVSKEEGGVTLPNNAPPFSDFVPKAGTDLDKQEEEHNRKRQERQQRRLEEQRASLEVNSEGEDDNDTDDILSSDEDIGGESTSDNPFLSSQANHPTLTELIFGEKFSMDEAEANYTPDKLKLLLAQILPNDGKVTEEDDIPMPQDDTPINFDMGQNLGPEKLKALHEMLGLTDEAGQQRKVQALIQETSDQDLHCLQMMYRALDKEVADILKNDHDNKKSKCFEIYPVK